MAITVKPDLNNTPPSTFTWEHNEIPLRYFVSGIPSGAYQQECLAAANATDSVTGVSIPQMATALPGTNYIISKVSCKCLGAGSWYVSVTATLDVISSGFAYEGSTSLRREDFYVDALGNPTAIQHDSSGAALTPPYLVGVPTAYPISTHDFTLIETVNPSPLRAKYAGNVNSVAFFGAAVGTLRLNDIRS